MKRSLTQIVASLMVATSLCACETQETQNKETRLSKGVVREVSLFLRPDKIIRNGYGEKIILTDFDNDGTYDVEEWIGQTPGAYRVRINKDCSMGYNIEFVDASYFDQYKD
ncbi:MAG: hypothetical protein V1729_06630 [Candidatus Woesearchaeota archaeon]